MPLIKSNGIELCYEQAGNGPDLILISGFSAPRQSWYPVYKQLAQHFRVTVFDNRGAGQSSVPDMPYTMAMMADDVVGLMDTLQIEKANVVGHSMGGLIVRALLANHQNRLHKAVLLCSALVNNPAWRYQVRFSQKLCELGLPADVQLEGIMSFMFGGAFLQDEDKVKEFIQRSTATPKNPVGMMNQNRAIVAFFEDPLQFDIKTPLLGVFGEEDLIVPVQQARRMLQKTMPQAEVAILPNCGHMAQFEQPAALVQTLFAFLQ